MIKIHSVDKDSKVLFEDGKGGGRSGTKQECESYGYKHNGTDCYSFRNTKVKTNKDNQNFGKSNVVIGKHNTVIGRGNRLHSSNNIAIGSHNLVSSSNGGGCIVMGKNAYLTEVSHAKGTALRDSHLNYDIEFAAINSTASDYIELKVEGANGDTAYWNVILNVTEVKVKL